MPEPEDDWYAQAMESREEAFAAQFGPTSPPDQVFKPQDDQWDLTIPGFAFLRYPPMPTRPYWLYLSHGLSQPMEEEDFEEGKNGGLSGFGVEFALATPLEEAWPLRMLESLASYILESGRPIVPLHRIPSTDLMDEATGGHLLAMENPGYQTEVRCLSGTVNLVHLVGVTAAEIALAKKHEGGIGSRILECALHAAGIGCVTDRKRRSITDNADFAVTWHACAALASASP